MILSTHSVVGAGAAYIATTNPLIAFLVGFASHFLLDALPHWEYNFSENFSNLDFKNKVFWIDFFKISLDVFIGFVLILFFIQANFSLQLVIWAGALGGVLPDVFQFLGFKKRLKPFVWFKKIHDKIHCDLDLKDQPMIGFFFQVFLILIFLF